MDPPGAPRARFGLPHCEGGRPFRRRRPRARFGGPHRGRSGRVESAQTRSPMKSIARVALFAAVTAAFGLTGEARAQHARQPVVPVDRGGTTPPVLSDPTGVYDGSV